MSRPVARFSPANFFLGGAAGRGVVRARDGKVTEAYTVEAEAKLLTSRKALVVKETYTFEAGRVDELRWDLPHVDDDLGLAPSEDRVINLIQTSQDGVDLIMRFARAVPAANGRTIRLDFAVRFSPLDAGHMMSFATIRRHGFGVGSMVTFYAQR